MIKRFGQDEACGHRCGWRAALALVVASTSSAVACYPDVAGRLQETPENLAVCGNDRKQVGERCDGQDLNGMSCTSLGFGAGVLGCRADCQDFDRAGCGAPEGCGDGVQDGVEVCDGEDLDRHSCEDLGFGAGQLDCLPNCGAFDTTGCGLPPGCGNDEIDGVAELCDGQDFGDLSCERLGFASGQLVCAADCLSYDKSGCVEACVPDCSGRQCGPDPVCGQSCGSCAVGSCDESTGDCVLAHDAGVDSLDADPPAPDSGPQPADAAAVTDVVYQDAGRADQSQPDAAQRDSAAPDQGVADHGLFDSAVTQDVGGADSEPLVCVEDEYEDNDRPESSVLLLGVEVDVAGMICADDNDVFRVEPTHAVELTVTLRFAHDEGDLDLYVDSEFGLHLRSAGYGDEEVVTVMVDAGDTVYITVDGYMGAQAAYTLLVSQVEPPACANDGFEPNSTMALAPTLTQGSLDGILCPHDLDWFKLSIAQGERVEVRLSNNSDDSMVFMDAVDASGREMSYAMLWERGEESVLIAPCSAGDFFVSIDANTAVRVGYTLTVTRFDDEQQGCAVPLSDGLDSCPALASDGTVYVAETLGHLQALRSSDGQPQWQFDPDFGAFQTGSPSVASDGTVYFNAFDQLYAVSATGHKVWSVALNDVSFSSPAVAADGTIYLGTSAGSLYAVRADGSVAWQHGEVDFKIETAPALAANGTVYVTCASPYDAEVEQAKVVALTPGGSVSWTYLVGSKHVSSPALATDGTIVVGTDAGLLALNSNGTLRWSREAGDWVFSAPVIAGDGTIFRVDGDGELWAYSLAGSLLWTYSSGALPGGRCPGPGPGRHHLPWHRPGVYRRVGHG